MPRPADQPESNSTLPQPELNPLVNPLLGQNMGRWAEVYFTSPPDKREEAVLNLLRELEEDASGTVPRSGTPPREIIRTGEAMEERPTRDFIASEQAQGTKRELVPCPSCSTKNPADQKFCGQCGALLSSEAVETDTPSWPSHAPSRNEAASFSSERAAPHQSSYQGADYVAHYEDPAASVETEDQTTIAYDDSRELTWLREVAAPQLMPEYEPVPYRYRIYVGAALAILIAALVYIAWRGTQASSGTQRTLPQAAPSAATQSPARSQAPPPPVAASSAKAASQNDKAKVPVPPDNKTTGQQANRATTRMDDTTEMKKVSAPASMSTNLPAERQTSLQDNGSRELAIAEGYLKGEQGKTRDSTEASKWLWQAVRKENAAATLLLSDLYLRGDGVPKSCDQGRLLLNAAARRGASGAGERIRNLQAFGCQ